MMPRHALIFACARSSSTSTAVVFQNLRQLAANRGLHVVREFLASPNRPRERDAMVDAVRAGIHGSGVIICSSMADLGTTVRNAVLFVDELLGRGWDVCTTEIDTTEPMARAAVTALVVSLRELEMRGVANRARDSLDRARREGRQLGRKQRDVPIETIREMLAAGRSWREIARATGIPASTLRTALKRQPMPSMQPLGLLEAA